MQKDSLSDAVVLHGQNHDSDECFEGYGPFLSSSEKALTA